MKESDKNYLAYFNISFFLFSSFFSFVLHTIGIWIAQNVKISLR